MNEPKEPRAFLAGIIVSAFLATTTFHIIFRPNDVIISSPLLVISTVATFFVFMER